MRRFRAGFIVVTGETAAQLAADLDTNGTDESLLEQRSLDPSSNFGLPGWIDDGFAREPGSVDWCRATLS